MGLQPPDPRRHRVGINAAGVDLARNRVNVSNVTIQNGTATTMGAAESYSPTTVYLRNASAVANGGGDGIVCGTGCLVISCVASGNTVGIDRGRAPL
jgi:xanthine/uracil/vitamin C permease (AzgA family)